MTFIGLDMPRTQLLPCRAASKLGAPSKGYIPYVYCATDDDIEPAMPLTEFVSMHYHIVDMVPKGDDPAPAATAQCGAGGGGAHGTSATETIRDSTETLDVTAPAAESHDGMGDKDGLQQKEYSPGDLTKGKELPLEVPETSHTARGICSTPLKDTSHTNAIT